MSRECCCGGTVFDCCCPVFCGVTPVELQVDFDLTGWKAWFDALATSHLNFTIDSGGLTFLQLQYRPTIAIDIVDTIVLVCCGSDVDNGMTGCTWCGEYALPDAIFQKRFTGVAGTTAWEDVPGVLSIYVRLVDNGDGTLSESLTINFVATDTNEQINWICTLPGCCPLASVLFYSVSIKDCPVSNIANFGNGASLDWDNQFQSWSACNPSLVLQTPAAPGVAQIATNSTVGGCTRTNCDEDCGTTNTPSECEDCPTEGCGRSDCYTGCDPPSSNNPDTGVPWKVYLIGSTDVGGTALDFTIDLGANACSSPPSTTPYCFCYQVDDFSMRVECYCSGGVWTLTIVFPFTGGSCTVTCTSAHAAGDCCPPDFYTETVGTPCSNGSSTATTFTGTMVYEYSETIPCESKP